MPRSTKLDTAPQSDNEAIRGAKDAAPLMIGLIPFGLVLGAQASAKGFSPLEVPLLTGSNFAGGSEFAAIGLWTSPPNLALIVGVTFLVNSRHLLMGATLAPFLHGRRKITVAAALFLMCDESWALGLAYSRQRQAAGHVTPLPLRYYFSVAVCLWLAWVVVTAAGAVVGPFVGDLQRFGLDMAFPAVFIALLRSMWTTVREAMPWLVALIVSVTVARLAAGAWYIPAGVVAGITYASWRHGR